MAGIRLTNLSSTAQVPLDFTAPVQQVSILETSNPKYPRLLVASNNGVVISRPGHSVGFSILDLIGLAASVDPVLALPPVITYQPLNAAVTDPAAATFTVAGTVEVGFSIIYQWQLQQPGTSTFVNITGAPYSAFNTHILNINPSTGLNGYLYRCLLYTSSDAIAGSLTVSNSALLTVHPSTGGS